MSSIAPTSTVPTSTDLTDAELLGRLVAFDSTSRNSNRPIAEFIADYLDRPGITIEEQFSPDGEKVNLVVRVGPEVHPETREGLVLSGHMDVVPAEEPEWKNDPFELTDGGESWVGRGACDMKGFVALAINAARRALARELTRPLVLILTYDEELGTLGAHHFASHWRSPLPRAAVIGEPSSLQAIRLHKGHAKARLIFHGEGAHSAYPHLGKNAIEPAARAVVAVGELRRALEGERPPYGEHFPETPYVSLNVAQIRGGSAINIVPERCEVDLGFRLLPGMSSAPLLERLQSVVSEALGDEPFELEFLNESPPLELAETSEIYGAVCDLIGQRETLAVSYATDAGWLSRLDLDCVIFGPGTIEVAHKPNEAIPKDEFERAAGLIDRLVERFCRV